MTNLRELSSLVLFGWEASAISSANPAHGELLNMPEYDVNTFTRRTRRLRSHAGGTEQPSRSKTVPATKEQGRRRSKKSISSAYVCGCSGASGKENVPGNQELPRSTLGPATPSHTTSAAQPAAVAAAPHIGTQSVEPSLRKLSPEAIEACTPQHVPGVPSSSYTATPSTVSPVLHTPSAAGSTDQGTATYPTHTNTVLHSCSNIGPVRTSAGPMASVGLAHGPPLPTAQCQSPRGCAVTHPSRPLARVRRRDSPEACPKTRPSTEVIGHSATDNRLRAGETPRPRSSDELVTEGPDDVLREHVHDVPSKYASAPSAVDAQALKNATPVQVRCRHDAAPPSNSLHPPQSSPLDILASVAASVAPADVQQLTAVAAPKPSVSQSAAGVNVPSTHAQAPAASIPHCLGSAAPLAMLASVLAEQCVPSSDGIPSAGSEQLPQEGVPARRSTPAVPPPVIQTGTAPVQATGSDADVEADLLHTVQVNSAASYDSAIGLHAAPTKSLEMVCPGAVQLQRPVKRRTTDPLVPVQVNSFVEAGADDLPPAKQHRQAAVSPVPEQLRTTHSEARADLPLASLFRPSKNLDLFLPSPKLPTGGAWIISWLP